MALQTYFKKIKKEVSGIKLQSLRGREIYKKVTAHGVEPFESDGQENLAKQN